MTLVKLYLVCYIQFWPPHYKRSIEVLECVLRSTMKIVLSLEHKSYKEF